MSNFPTPLEEVIHHNVIKQQNRRPGAGYRAYAVAMEGTGREHGLHLFHF